MKNDNIKKINSLGKVGKILSTILIVITTISMVAMIISCAAVCTLPENFLDVNGKWSSVTVADFSSPLINGSEGLEDYSDEVELHGLKIKSFSKETADSNNKDIITTTSETTIEGNASKPLRFFGILVTVVITIFLALLMVSLRFAKTLCKALEKCETPFAEDVVQKMRNFAISLIPWGLFAVGACGIGAVGVVFIIIVVMLFSAIFRHGAELQRQSDETL